MGEKEKREILELQRSNKEWGLTFDAVTDPIFILDKEHKIVNANRAFAKFINLKLDDIIGKYCFELIHQTKVPIPGCPADKTLRDSKSYTEEINEPKLGITLLVSTSPIFNDKGELVGAVHIARDITEFKRTSTAQAQLAAIVESSEDAIIGKSLEGIIFSWNKGAENVYGYSADEIIGKNVSVLIPAQNKDEVARFLEKVKRGESIAHYETKRVRKDGKQIIVSIAISPIKDAAGNIIGASTIAHDITERKRIEDDLRSSELKFKTLFESSRDAIMLVSPEKGFFSGNSSAVALYGCKNEAEFIRKTPAELSPELQPDGKLSSIKSLEMMAIAMEKGSHFFEWKHRRMNGEEFLTDVLLTKMEWGGEVVLQATVRDITQRKTMEEDLNKRITALERFQKVTVDRELRMKELKARISELESKLRLNNGKDADGRTG
jgi:PAS domain S-box-containing protein